MLWAAELGCGVLAVMREHRTHRRTGGDVPARVQITAAVAGAAIPPLAAGITILCIFTALAIALPGPAGSGVEGSPEAAGPFAAGVGALAAGIVLAAINGALHRARADRPLLTALAGTAGALVLSTTALLLLGLVPEDAVMALGWITLPTTGAVGFVALTHVSQIRTGREPAARIGAERSSASPLGAEGGTAPRADVDGAAAPLAGTDDEPDPRIGTSGGTALLANEDRAETRRSDD